MEKFLPKQKQRELKNLKYARYGAMIGCPVIYIAVCLTAYFLEAFPPREFWILITVLIVVCSGAVFLSFTALRPDWRMAAYRKTYESVRAGRETDAAKIVRAAKAEHKLLALNADLIVDYARAAAAEGILPPVEIRGQTIIINTEREQP